MPSKRAGKPLHANVDTWERIGLLCHCEALQDALQLALEMAPIRWRNRTLGVFQV